MEEERFKSVKENSYDYFERTLITENGFREYDVRWILGREINPNGFVLLGRAYGTLIQRSLGEGRVVVGHDFRSYSQDLLRSFTVGLLSTGVDVIDIGLALTPMVYFAQHRFEARGGGMVTASHNENGWTGLKLANGLSSTLGPEGIAELKRVVFGMDFVEGRGSYTAVHDLFDAYRSDLLRDGPLKDPMRVVVAAGNGTAGRFLPSILTGLGCEVVERDCAGDWTFPRHNPNPEDVAFVEEIGAKVRECGAALGIGIDGDGDRLGVVDERGRMIFSDTLGLLVARRIAEDHPNRAIVIDVKSTGLYLDDPVLLRQGMRTVMWKTGHSYIKAKTAELDAIAGFEKSGHWFLRAPYGRGYDDAAQAAVLVIRTVAEAGRSLASLLETLPKTWQSPTLGVECADDRKYGVVDELVALYEKDRAEGRGIAGARIKDLVTVNGVRFLLEDEGWGLVRASSNKPSLVVVAESRTSDAQMRAIIDSISARLRDVGVRGEYDQPLS